MRLLLVIVGVGLLLAGGVTLVRTALDLPPVGLVARYGFPPAGGPTGRRVEIEGVTFVEIGAGYFRMGSWHDCDRGDLLGRLCARLGLPRGKQPGPQGNEVPVRWVRIARPYFIAVTEVTNPQYERFDPDHERGEASAADAGPVTNVDWYEARRYCEWLSSRGALSVRLPSDAEWENAARERVGSLRPSRKRLGVVPRPLARRLRGGSGRRLGVDGGRLAGPGPPRREP